MPYIEIKTRRQVSLTLARKVAEKGDVSAILTTGTITAAAKALLDECGIAYAENVPEGLFRGEGKR